MENLYQLLKKYFGFDHFRPLQEQIITNVLAKKNSLVLMPTGGGKSICYQLPALAMDGTALIISPLIALMKDQVGNLRANGIPAAFINSSLSGDEEREITEKCLNNEYKLLYLSPERALSLLDSWLPSLNVSLIAIDEAHCISQWGHDFRPEYTRLHILRQVFPDKGIIALTATADKTTRRDIIQQLQLDASEVFISSFDRPNLRLDVLSGLNLKKKHEEVLKFINKRKGESGIIYCLSRKKTEEISGFLQRHGIDSSYYHAGMSSEERNLVQDAFIKDDQKIICATIAFGMGIDKSNIRWIIHYNIPKNMEGYYQEIGRAGRDGVKSDTLLFFNLSDLILLTQFAKESGQPQLNSEKLRRIQEYAESRICRRRILLNYFGENYSRNCNNCDVCSHPPQLIDGTVAAQKALSAIIRTGEKTGFTMLINILRGSHNAELLAKNFNAIKTYGTGKEYSYDVWLSYILQFLQLGLIEIAYDDGHHLKVTGHGKDVLKANETVSIAAYKTQKQHDVELSEENETQSVEDKKLFAELRKLRKLISDSEGLLPYHVFSDKTLLEMVAQKPVTRDAMLSIQGVSQKKFERYGDDFLKLIISELPSDYVAPESTLQQAIQPARIKEYIEIMQEQKIPVSHAVLGKILLGSATETLPQHAFNLPFYGLLKNKTKYKNLASQLRELFTENVIKNLENAPDDFFGTAHFNRMTFKAQQQLAALIDSLPLNRPSVTISNEYILEQRKTYPRSYEHWQEPEISVFREVTEQTNDLEFISKSFQRNPDSIKAYYKKLAIKNALVTI